MPLLLALVAQLWGWAVEPLQFPFMQRALGAAVVLGLVSGLTSTWTVVRGMAFFADALAHAVLPGVALAYVVWGASGTSLFWGAVTAALVASVAVHAIARQGGVREETAIGVVMAAALALGVAIISTRRAYAVDLAHVLFGDILSVGQEDLVRAGVVGGVAVLAALALWRPFAIVSFDPTLGASLGLKVEVIDYAILALIAVTTVVALQTVGVTMSLAILVMPGATARLMAGRLSSMAAAATGVAVTAALAGLYVSYYFSIPSGPAIVLVNTLLFATARLVAAPSHPKAARR